MPRFVLRTAICACSCPRERHRALLAAGPGRSGAVDRHHVTPTRPVPTTPPPTLGMTTSPSSDRARVQRPRLGSRRSDWASGVRTAMPCTAGRTTGSSPTTTPGRRSGRPPSRRSGCSSLPATKVTLGATAAVARSPTRRATGRRSRVTAPLTLQPSLAIDGVPLTGAAHDHVGRPLLVNGHAFRGRLTVAVRRQGAAGRRHGRARGATSKGVVAAEMPTDVARSGARGAGRRGALLRPREPAEGRAVRPVRRRPQPGLRRRGSSRRRATNAAVDATRGRVVLWQGKVADTVYSSSSGGRTASRRGGAGAGSPLPRLRRRSVRQPVAVPRLGPHRRRRRGRGARSEAAQQGGGRADDR